MSSEPRMPKAKRLGPPDVEPVIIDNVRYEAIHWGRDRGLGQNGGYIAAFDNNTNAELWTLKVYSITYDPKMERDVQDVFIESIEPEGNRLVVTDEDDRTYVVNLETRTVTRR